MYEAVLSTGEKPGVPQSETDAEIEKFLPLLKDYLTSAFCVHCYCLGLTSSGRSERVRADTAQLRQGRKGHR